jgi:hypothetical protein
VQAVASEATGELYQWFKRMDSSRPVFVDLGAFCEPNGPRGWVGDVRKKLYGDLFKQCDVAGMEAAGIDFTGDVGLAAAELSVMYGNVRPVFARFDLRAKDSNSRQLSPKALRARAWAAIIWGAKALGYRVPPDKGLAGLDDEMKAELKRLNGQLTKLAPIILAAPSKAKVEMTLIGGDGEKIWSGIAAKEPEGGVAIFAQSFHENVPGKATIKFAGLKAGTKIEVVDENRSITAEEGQFSDDCAPLAEHVYRWKQ